MTTPLFDGGCFAGHDLETGYHYPVDCLLADWDRHGIAGGLVGSYRALYQDTRAGNREAAAWAGQYPDRITPLAILNPARYGEPPETLLDWLHDELGFRHAALFSHPAYYAVHWDSPAVRALGEAAAARGMTLQAGIRTESELAAVARAWGHLSTPVQIRWMGGHRYLTLAAEIAVAAACPHFRFDIGSLCSTGAVAHLAERLGPERLFFASNAPHNLMACGRAVAGEAAAAVRDGLVDIHWHPDGWNLGEPGLRDDEQIAVFERHGYERVVMFSILALNYDIAAGNALTEGWFEKDPRIFGMIVVNPLQPETSLAQIERYAAHPRFVGVKTIQDVFGLGLDDARYEPILERAAEERLPVLAHMPGMDICSRRFPEITFIAAHANWGRAQRFLGLPNVCFDFSTSHALRHEIQLARFVRAVGAQRVLFGSDAPLVSPAWSLAMLEDAGLSEAENTQILRENAYRVFPKLQGNEP